MTLKTARRITIFFAGWALACLWSSFVHAQSPGQQLGQTPAGQYVAIQYGLWQVVGQTPNLYAWPQNTCLVNAGGKLIFPFAVGAPVLIQDSDPTQSEVVTPSTVTNDSGRCSITIAATHIHNSFVMKSATRGLQEAINAAGTSTAQVLITNDWFNAGGTLAMVLAAQGNSHVAVLDYTDMSCLPVPAAYLWNGSAYAKAACSSGGGGLTSFTSGNLSPLFTTSLGGTPLTAPALTFSLSNAAQNGIFAGSCASGTGSPAFRALCAADLPIFIASGASHAAGAVPDPGASAGTTRFLREDATWAAVVSGINQLTGDATAGPGSGSQALTLATVNGTPGTCTHATVNAKGLATACAPLVPADYPVFVASGASHAIGAVPDPGSTAGSAKFLREDASWQVPSYGLSGLLGQLCFYNATGTQCQGDTNAVHASNTFVVGDTNGLTASQLVANGGSLSQMIDTGIPNDGTTGTTALTLAKINSSGNAITIATSDTAIRVYPVVAAITSNGTTVCAPTTTGKACLVRSGEASITFDAAGGTAGHYVGASTATAGDAIDLGTTVSAGTYCIGKLLTSPAASTAGTVALGDCPTVAGGGGTVTSVALTTPGVIFSSPAGGSPVTTSGTLALALLTQSANVVLAGPASGGAVTPTFRSLVTADFPISGVTAGSYTAVNATVDATGRVTAMSNGTAPNNAIMQMFIGAATTMTASSNYTFYTNVAAPAVSSAGTHVGIPVPFAGSVKNLEVHSNLTIATGNTLVYTVNDGATGQALTCTITGGASAFDCSDTTHSFSAAKGDLLSVTAVCTGTCGSNSMGVMDVTMQVQ